MGHAVPQEQATIEDVEELAENPIKDLLERMAKEGLN
jgi:hypothetical protein